MFGGSRGNAWSRQAVLIGTPRRKLSIGIRLIEQLGFEGRVRLVGREALEADGAFQIFGEQLHSGYLRMDGRSASVGLEALDLAAFLP
jgi:hypothetical protein